MAVELTDRDLGAWIVEHVMRWTEGEEYHLVATPDGKELLAYDPALPGQGDGLRTSSRTWDPTTSLNACALAEEKINEMGLAEECVMALIDPEYVEENRLTFPTLKQIFRLVTASARRRCEAMWLIREKIDDHKRKGGT